MIKFLDLQRINNRFRQEFEETFSSALDKANFILGENVRIFERQFADYCGTKYAVGTGNGLDALTLILKGYIVLGKLNKGDKVIVPANTFIATVLSVIHAELIPVFADPNPHTYNLSETSVMPHLTEDVKAIVMVHLYGQLADVVGLKYLAQKYDLLLIEDAAQAHGARMFMPLNDTNTEQSSVGNLSDAAAFSFYPSKNLGALGDGGAVTTNDMQLVEVLKLLCNYGSQKKYHNDIIGFNSRLDDLQAAFLSIKLKYLDDDNLKRQTIAKRYLGGIKNSKIKLPQYSGDNNHVFYAFVVEVANRNHFISFLNKNSIGWLIHYPIPPHKQLALKSFSALSFPISEGICQRIVSLPISPVMDYKTVDKIIHIINTY